MLRGQPPQTVAQVLFGLLTGSAVLYCLLSGVRATADCLSEEKREGTLGLLFLTDLKGYDVVLGKLAATSVGAFYGVLAVVPMLAVPLLMGGVTLGEFERMAVVALNTLFFSLTAGICVSSLCRSGRTAIGATFLLILLLTAVLPMAGAIATAYNKLPSLRQILFLPSAGFSFYLGFDTSYRSAPRLFWSASAVMHCLGWIFLGSAAFIAPRTWQDRPAGVKKLHWRERWKAWSYGTCGQRDAYRARLLGTNAFYWLAARARLKPALVWGVLGLLACGWLWGLAKFRHEWLTVEFYSATGSLLNIMLKLWFASEAGRQLIEDRKRGALELLLSTPLTVSEILRGQRLALQRQFLGPVLAVLAVDTVLMLATWRQTAHDADTGSFLMIWPAGMVLLVADIVALYWVGMWQAVSTKNPNRATGASVLRVLVLPWMLFALISLIISLTTVRTGGQEPGGRFFVSLWLVPGLVADIGFGVWSRSKLLAEFRLAAAQRYTAQPGFWRRLLTVNTGACAGQALPVTDR
jgi:ABC-type Na+ efflux pump permease subunit